MAVIRSSFQFTPSKPHVEQGLDKRPDVVRIPPRQSPLPRADPSHVLDDGNCLTAPARCGLSGPQILLETGPCSCAHYSSLSMVVVPIILSCMLGVRSIVAPPFRFVRLPASAISTTLFRTRPAKS
jgi:hypothetical protein